MSNVRFYGTNAKWPVGRAAFAIHGGDRFDFDRITEDRTRAMGFDVIDIGGADARVAQRRRSTACCAGPFGTDNPLLRPS